MLCLKHLSLRIRENAIDDSYAEGAPDLDDFSFLFYQKFRPLIKRDLMALVKVALRGRGGG
jgi:hypothetical protein